MAERYSSSSEENLKNTEIKNRVINIFNDFVSDVDPDQLSDWLIAKRIITVDRWNEIRNEKTRQKKCRELLLHLLSISHPTAFIVVRDALEKDCRHIWEKIENQITWTTEEAGLKFDTRWKKEKDKLVKEMNEERQQWNKEKEVLENHIRELNQELLKSQQWKKEKEALENHIMELNQELLKSQQWKKEKEALDNRNRELNEELLKWKNEKENLEKSIQATKQSASIYQTGILIIPQGSIVQGLTKLNDNIYVLMTNVKKVFVFEDEFPFRFKKAVAIKKIKQKNDLTSSNKTKCLYVSDVSNKCIWKIRTNDDQVTKWVTNIDGLLPAISVTTDDSLLILRGQLSIICLEFYDVTDAKQVATLPLPKIIHAPLCCIQEPSGNFIISHLSKKEPYSPWIISRLTNDGEINCQFNPVEETQKLNYPAHLCLDPDNNRLFVVDYCNQRIVLLDSKSLIWSHIVLGKEGNESQGSYPIVYDGKKRQLIVWQCSQRHVSVFSVY